MQRTRPHRLRRTFASRTLTIARNRTLLSCYEPCRGGVSQAQTKRAAGHGSSAAPYPQRDHHFGPDESSRFRAVGLSHAAWWAHAVRRAGPVGVRAGTLLICSKNLRLSYSCLLGRGGGDADVLARGVEHAEVSESPGASSQLVFDGPTARHHPGVLTVHVVDT